MIVDVDVRDAALLLGLRNSSKRIVFAVANAVNNTAKEVRIDVRAHAAGVLTLRDKRDFILRQAAYIGKEDFASAPVGRLQARVSVNPRPGLLLPGLEAGFERKPKIGTHVAVPVEARSSKAAAIPAALYIKAMALRRGVTPTGRKRKGGTGASIRGRERTYIVPDVGIFQRTGKMATRLLYSFARPFHVDATLGFLATARATVSRFFAPEMRRQVYETIRFNRGR